MCSGVVCAATILNELTVINRLSKDTLLRISQKTNLNQRVKAPEKVTRGVCRVCFEINPPPTCVASRSCKTACIQPQISARIKPETLNPTGAPQSNARHHLPPTKRYISPSTSRLREGELHQPLSRRPTSAPRYISPIYLPITGLPPPHHPLSESAPSLPPFI